MRLHGTYKQLLQFEKLEELISILNFLQKLYTMEPVQSDT